MSMFWASADYAPSAHFYPALSRDPSPRVYSCRASVTNCFKPKHEIFFRKEGKALLTQQLNAARPPTTDYRLRITLLASRGESLQAPSSKLLAMRKQVSRRGLSPERGARREPTPALRALPLPEEVGKSGASSGLRPPSSGKKAK